MSIVTFPEPSLAVGGGSGPICLGYANINANQAGITTEVDVTGLSVTVNIPAGRTIKVTAFCHMISSLADQAGQIRIKQDGSEVQFAQDLPSVAGERFDLTASVILSPTAGVHTYKVTALRGGASNSLTVSAFANDPSYLLVEDITGTPAPGVGTQGLWAVHPGLQLLQPGLITHTVVYAKYTRIGNTIISNGRLTVTGAGTAGNNVRISVPVVEAGALAVCSGHGWIYDASTSTTYNGGVNISGTSFDFFVDGVTAGGGWGTFPNLALANGDVISWHCSYEAA